MSDIEAYRNAQFTEEYAQQRAAEAGCTVEHSQPHVLQLDLDGEQAYNTFREQVPLLYDLGLLPMETRVHARSSKSGVGIHIMVVMPNQLDWHWPVSKRIMVQALLGSDPKREALALAGQQAGQPNPILFFRPKEDVPMPAWYKPQHIEFLTAYMSDLFAF